jgi:hypothetical protein
MASSTRIPTAYRQWLHAMLMAPVVAAAAGRPVTGE